MGLSSVKSGIGGPGNTSFHDLALRLGNMELMLSSYSEVDIVSNDPSSGEHNRRITVMGKPGASVDGLSDTDYPWKVTVSRNEGDTAWVATVSDLSYLQDSVANTAEVAVTDVDEEITITEAKRLVLEWNAAAENWTLKAVNNAGFQPTSYNESSPFENTYSLVTIATFHKPGDVVLLERQYVRNILAQCWIADSGNAAFFARPI